MLIVALQRKADVRRGGAGDARALAVLVITKPRSKEAEQNRAILLGSDGSC